jgi:hypothetical protein
MVFFVYSWSFEISKEVFFSVKLGLSSTLFLLDEPNIKKEMLPGSS